MASGFGIVTDGVTITLTPDGDDGVLIGLHSSGRKVEATEGAAILEDPKSLARVIDGMYADLSAAAHQSE